MVSKDCRYTEKHEWARKEGDAVYVGISDYAQNELGDIVFVEIPQEGGKIAKGDTITTIESVKAVSDIYAPIGGTIIAVNGKLEDEPETINSDPFGEGWIVSIAPDDPSAIDQLLSSEEYEKLIKEA